MYNRVLYDEGIMDAIDLYIRYGISPGSCAMAMIKGDLTKAILHAHPLIKENDIAKNTFDIINNDLPEICLGYENYNNWVWHGGFESASEDVKAEFAALLSELHITKKLKDEPHVYKIEILETTKGEI